MPETTLVSKSCVCAMHALRPVKLSLVASSRFKRVVAMLVRSVAGPLLLASCATQVAGAAEPDTQPIDKLAVLPPPAKPLTLELPPKTSR